MATDSLPAAPLHRPEDDHDAFQRLVEPFRAELHRHCYRMTDYPQDAEDLVQETFLRAWRARDTLYGTLALRAWLYRIATRACLDELERHPRSSVYKPERQPIDGSAAMGPEEHYDLRESAQLAFRAAVQYLPPRQRAVLLVREVLGWSPTESAALLDMSVASVNSALQRARTTLRTRCRFADAPFSSAASANEAERSVLERYLRAWEQADVDALIALLREEASPETRAATAWLDHGEGCAHFLAAQVFGRALRGRVKRRPSSGKRGAESTAASQKDGRDGA